MNEEQVQRLRYEARIETIMGAERRGYLTKEQADELIRTPELEGGAE